MESGYKMTGRATKHVGMKNRGNVKTGFYAHLVLFDSETIKDSAAITNPTALSDGNEMVIPESF